MSCEDGAPMSHAVQVLIPGISDRTAPTHDRSWLSHLKEREEGSWETIRSLGMQRRHHLSDRATYVLVDVLRWLADLPANSIHAVVTDPPYGMIEYDEKNHGKLRQGRGGVWRIPPSFDGAKRRPLPRFTVLSKEEIINLPGFFTAVTFVFFKDLSRGGAVFTS